ncbi:kin of IRRE-like protein 1 [Apostichopus japonicus]|uniref:kin of IRRE-like protein 1 n=1 Tax=Stichopus japonicus TaxID=307972 RepID=UPI003AB5351A
MAALEIFLFLQAFVCVVVSTPSFSQMPEQRSALAEGDVTFYCVVRDLERHHVVQWLRGMSAITRNAAVLIPPSNPDSRRISVIADPSVGQYNLQISNVQQSDDLTYICSVYNSTDNTQILSSGGVRLEVHTIPDQRYPQCTPLDKPEYEEGSNITISCTSRRSNPPVLLQWYQGGTVIEGAKLDDSDPGFRSLRYVIKTKHTDDRSIYQCKMTTSAIESLERSCSLGPLNVVYKPRVGLLLPEGDVEDGQQIQLNCQAEAKPEPFGYRWTSSIPFQGDEIEYLKNSKTILLTASARLNGTQISCVATNIQGSGSSNKVRLYIQPKGHTTTEDSITDRKGDKFDPAEKDPSKPLGPEVPGSVVAPAPGLSSRLLLLIIGILSLMLIVLLLVLIFYTCRSYQSNGNHSIIYGTPSSICNGANIDRAWDQNSVYFEPRDQLSVGEAPTWLRSPKQPQWRRNVAVQVPFVEDPPYAEIEQDWDDGVYTLQI